MKINLRRFLIYICCLLFVLTSLIGCTSEVSNIKDPTLPLTLEEKLEDFEYLYTIIEENYPFLNVNKRVNNIDWLANKNEYKSQIERTETNDIFMRQISYIVRQLNNGHTHVVGKQEFGWYCSVYAGLEGSSAFNRPWAQVFKNEKVLDWYEFDETDMATFEHKGYFGFTAPAFKTDIIVPNEVAYLKISLMNGGMVEEDGKDPLFFSLPNSGIVIRFRSFLALNRDETINEEVKTTPDIEIDSTIGATYDKDQAIQYIIQEIQ